MKKLRLTPKPLILMLVGAALGFIVGTLLFAVISQLTPAILARMDFDTDMAANVLRRVQMLFSAVGWGLAIFGGWRGYRKGLKSNSRA